MVLLAMDKVKKLFIAGCFSHLCGCHIRVEHPVLKLESHIKYLACKVLYFNVRKL